MLQEMYHIVLYTNIYVYTVGKNLEGMHQTVKSGIPWIVGLYG